jgi:hypothetical protein
MEELCRRKLAEVSEVIALSFSKVIVSDSLFLRRGEKANSALKVRRALRFQINGLGVSANGLSTLYSVRKIPVVKADYVSNEFSTKRAQTPAPVQTSALNPQSTNKNTSPPPTFTPTPTSIPSSTLSSTPTPAFTLPQLEHFSPPTIGVFIAFP